MRGWILDLYPGKPGEMVVWLKGEDGEAVRLVDSWSPSIYIATDNRTDLDIPLKVVRQELAWTQTVRRYERVTDQEMSEVVEAKVKDAKRLQRVAGRIERLGPFGAFRIYNADVPPNQSYLYERDLFPLAYCKVAQVGCGLEWRLEDDVMDYQYRLPSLKTVAIDAAIHKQGKIPKDTDRIEEIVLKDQTEELVIDCASEADKILELVRLVRALDPDFVTTRDGDTFLFPYLIRRAKVSGVSEQLSLDRDGTILRLPTKKGTSFFSYGKIHYKPAAIKLCGRVHIDTANSFSYSEAGFHGLFELSRICRMPLQTASRASIGKALSSLQFYQAFKMGLLIPWKPTLAERFKDRVELLVADRGGFIFEPKMGLYEGVAELDFACLVRDTIVKTRGGAKPIADVSEGTEVLTPFGWQKTTRIHQYRIRQKLIRITLADGKKITCTPQHKFPVLVRDVFEEKTADRIHKGSKFIVADELPVFRTDDFACLFGVFTAEGCRVRKDAKYFDRTKKTTRISHQYRVEFSIDKRETDLRDFIASTLLKTYPTVHVYTRTKRGSNGITLVIAQKTAVMDFLSRYDVFIANERHTHDEMASFVRGFFEGDGSVNKKRNTVQCDQSSKNRFKLEVVCKYLRELKIGYRVGRYTNKGFSSISADFLELSGLEGVVRYYTQIGFISQRKQESLRKAILARIRKAKNYPNPRLGLYAKAQKNNALSFIHEVRVVRKEALGYNGTVYDLTLEWDEFPYYFANGILTHNSLYPSIMLKKNISAETVRCPCCLDSDNRVPELGWNVCKKRKGIVARSMEIIVKKRLGYKELKKAATGTGLERYDQCLAALKWIGVATFGYLSFNNAKFGRIDAHIAVCAWDRKVLVDAARIAERRGFVVIHGIVDSLWLKRDGAEEADYLELKKEIEEETGFTMSFEGIYKWIAFLPSKVDAGLPVLNRYFGAYRDGALKVRGIEARRHDTPQFFKRCQMEILRMLAKADSVREAREMLPQCVEVFRKYADALQNHEAPTEELAFAVNISKKPEEYANNTLQTSAVRQLTAEGVELHAGEGIRYVIRDYRSSGSMRATPTDLLEGESGYDHERYIELLAEACASVLQQFDAKYDSEGLSRISERGRQETLAQPATSD